ncbi:spore gernimation protein [Paenibacillus psychroresistens]|uniref:Spore gernimation protein n=1 Tax=Paenibacillus psychroresistens TaxID=1778678 RepID=A0A6B8RQG2_9BACL|nr:endospore germination permease [Paenibacillus psychroresistens]QGQ98610.1 spore gernimation protein [Paenibacillus psychroresistens]
MNKYQLSQITFLQYVYLISGIQIGVSLLYLPRLLAETAGTDGWISLIIGWIIAVCISVIIIKIMKKHPDSSIIDILPRYFGKWLGNLITIAYAIYFLLVAYIVIDRTVLYTKLWSLQQTSSSLILLMLLIPTYMIGKKSIRITGRYAELVFFLFFWMGIIYLVPLKHAHWLHLLPFIKEGWQPILLTVKTALYAFSGFESAFFLYPFLTNKKLATVGIVMANTISLSVFLLVTLVCFLFFSPDEITHYFDPSIEVLKVIEFRFLERFDVCMFIAYIFVLTLTWIPLLQFCVLCTSHIMGKADPKNHFLIVLLLILAITYFINPTFKQNDSLRSVVNIFKLILAFIFPICLLLYSFLYDYFQRRKAA